MLTYVPPGQSPVHCASESIPVRLLYFPALHFIQPLGSASETPGGLNRPGLHVSVHCASEINPPVAEPRPGLQSTHCVTDSRPADGAHFATGHSSEHLVEERGNTDKRRGVMIIQESAGEYRKEGGEEATKKEKKTHDDSR